VSTRSAGNRARLTCAGNVSGWPLSLRPSLASTAERVQIGAPLSERVGVLEDLVGDIGGLIGQYIERAAGDTNPAAGPRAADGPTPGTYPGATERGHQTPRDESRMKRRRPPDAPEVA
jgi:hypothetical protein